VHQIDLDLLQTAAVAVISLFVGLKIKNHFEFMNKYCIPSTVVGGIVVSIFLSLFYIITGYKIPLDDTIEHLFMIIFFTSIGFQVNLFVLRHILRPLVVMVICITFCIIMQNMVVLSVAYFNLSDPYLAITAGPITMMGGEGLAKIYGPILQDLNLEHGISLTRGMATLGLIIGALLGGPLGRFLILKHKLRPDPKVLEGFLPRRKDKEPDNSRVFERIARAFYQLIIAMGVGITIYQLLKQSGIVIPMYISTMVSAIVIKNMFKSSKHFEIEVREITYLGGLALSLFLGIAFAELELYNLLMLKPIQLVLLILQLAVVVVFALCIFKFSGKNYDAAILSGASLGFGIGATPSSISSIITLNGKYGYSVVAFLLVPIAGTIIADPINSLIIEFVIKLL
jgi:ESS family glutamate:Na+ symporter